MAAKFGGDIAAILEDACKRQEASGRAVWQGPSSNETLPPATPAPVISDNNVPSPQVGQV